jgi:hypothetical protein
MPCIAWVYSYRHVSQKLTLQHQVLLFRDLKLTPKQQYELTLVS